MSRLKQPQEHDDLLNYQLKRLLNLGGAPAIRLCEGRYGVARMEWRLVAALQEDGPMPLLALVRRTGIDQARVSRVVTNLVSNAVKFSPQGQTVTVTVRQAGGSALLMVDDAGPGSPLLSMSEMVRIPA